MNGVKGRHIVVDAFDCDPLLLDDLVHLEKLLNQIVSSLGMQILATSFHRFEPQGVTGIILLSTSHISIHTWPEYSYAAFDLFTCGDDDPATEIETLIRGLSSKSALVYGIDRSNTGSGEPAIWSMQSQLDSASTSEHENNITVSNFSLGIDSASNRGDNYDQIERNEILAGKHTMLYEGTSNYQRVELIEANDMRMYLDGQLQFSSLDERIYHEALVHPAFLYAASPKRVLIVGGGDGLAVREVLKYPGVEHVDLVDLDPMVLDVARLVPAVVSLNESSLHNPRVHVYAQDAAQFLDLQRPSYQIIVVDFPDPADEIISTLYTKEFFQRLAAQLSDDGVMVCQSFSPEDAPTVYWSIELSLKAAGLHTQPYHCLVPSFGDWGFHLAAQKPLIRKTDSIPVPARTLPADIDALFAFKQDIMLKRANATTNSLGNLVLHKYYQQEAGNSM